jgi:hypothetical protein
MEIDIVQQSGKKIMPSEIKSGMTLQDNFFKNIIYWNKLSGSKGGRLIYGGEDSYTYKGMEVVSWRSIE